ncbi:MAG: hypothetical protein JSW47_14465, partial [Phycisphaerales bacterium]
MALNGKSRIILCLVFVLSYSAKAEIQGTRVAAGMQMDDTLEPLMIYATETQKAITRADVTISYEPWQAVASSRFSIPYLTSESARVEFGVEMEAHSGGGRMGGSSFQINHALIHYYAQTDMDMNYSYSIDYAGWWPGPYLGLLYILVREGLPYVSDSPFANYPYQWEELATDGMIGTLQRHHEGSGSFHLEAGKSYTFVVWTGPGISNYVGSIGDKCSTEAHVALQFGEEPEPVGRAFTYQGRLNYKDEPADGNFDFEFDLYGSEDSDKQIGDTVSIAEVNVVDGTFTVDLDFGDDPNTFNGDSRWIEVKVRPTSGGDYTILTPRQRITAVPYALHALNCNEGPAAQNILLPTNESPPGYSYTGRSVTARSDSVWRDLSEYPQGRHAYFAMAGVSDKVLVTGGWIGESPDEYHTTYLYDPGTGDWSRAAEMPRLRDRMHAVEAGGKVYLLGGRGGQIGNDEYDPVTNTWTEKAPIPVRREEFAAASVGGRVYVIGGISSFPEPDWATYEYDPNSNAWTALSAMPGNPRMALTAAALNGKIYVFGGRVLGGTDISAQIDEYDPVTDTWAVMAKGQMDVGRYNHKAVTVGSKILVLGGNDGLRTLSTCAEYDPQENTWDSYMMSMPREMDWR